ncbi:DUF177 domain-containing protein [Cognatiyoonia sp. IB215446]|uniref:YceD family protein n=1 Tax=Cognatiyoonia sp. IB215446 TaxID=3097355 RepID=UPI002A1054E1|nr:DUF177 domain-containing protein [Cognatiyoonia sp. IB215446]MDX8349743.1 DUF177 domain-containing protein [Cognatiyoonia sp. IB215446]
MTALPPSHLRLADLPNRRATDFALVPTAEERAGIADELGITQIRKLRFAGQLTTKGARDWALDGTLGATVVQPCVTTLDPVTTRIDVEVTRSYVADWVEPDGGESEMPEDDTVEPLPTVLDLNAVMIEALALALPDYPRSEGAQLDETVFAEPGVTPMTDEAARPFAALGALREELEKKGK